MDDLELKAAALHIKESCPSSSTDNLAKEVSQSLKALQVTLGNLFRPPTMEERPGGS